MLQKTEQKVLLTKIENLKTALIQQEDIIFAYLFGSYATGKFHKKSDIDIAVFLKESVDVDFFYRKLELIDLVSAIIKKNKIDIVILNQATPFVVHSVLKTGKLLFCKNEKVRISFEVKNMREYMELFYYLQKHWKAMAKRIKERKFGF